MPQRRRGRDLSRECHTAHVNANRLAGAWQCALHFCRRHQTGKQFFLCAEVPIIFPGRKAPRPSAHEQEEASPLHRTLDVLAADVHLLARCVLYQTADRIDIGHGG